MERNVKISLEKAKEWYNSGNESLKEVALQAFKESELIVNPWENIKTFEDACKVLNVNPKYVDLLCGSYLQNMFKLQIIRRALNADWKPIFNEGTIYYPCLRYYTKDSSYNSRYTPVANFKDKKNNKVYTLIGGDYMHSAHETNISIKGSSVVYTDYGLLGCKSKEIAKYFGIIFGKLIFDVTYGQYNNYTWI